MRYVGIHTQIAENNRNSILLLLSFPCIILLLVWVMIVVLNFLGIAYISDDQYYSNAQYVDWDSVGNGFVQTVPFVIAGVGIWFTIAYFCNASIIQSATGAHSVTRKENPRIYNIVENLCMACNMPMPMINVVDDPQLNAFASGINDKTYTVTVTTGICDMLDDDELAGVIAHELTHIRNRDTKVLITSIVFVGIISTVLSILTNYVFRIFLYSGGSRRSSNKKGGGGAVMIAIVVAIVCTAIAYFFTLLTRFAISRKREFMADAGGAELCGNPQALASALRKISNNPGLNHVDREDVAQLFIIHPDKMKQGFMDKLNSMFSTHPDTAERIRILEQF